MISIENARAAGGYTVAIRDEAGVCALADLSEFMNHRLAPCANAAIFPTLRAALGTIVWPGGFDIDPENVFASIIPNTEELARVTLEQMKDTTMLHPLEHPMPIVSVFFLVEAWIELHRDELLANWELMKAGLAPERVKPLQ